MSANSNSGLRTLPDNLEVMITNLVYMGPAYDPEPLRLKILGLQTRLSAVRALFNDVSNAESVFDAAVKVRADAFALLPDVVTRVLNLLKALSPNSPVMNAVKKTVRELRGKRASDPPLNPDGTPKNPNSVAKTTYKDLTDLLGKLIDDLETDPKYAPKVPDPASGERDLTTAGLTAFRNELSAKNSAVDNARTPLQNARAARDEALFDEEDGLVTVAHQVKAFVKGWFGSNSPQFKQINGLRFSHRKR